MRRNITGGPCERIVAETLDSQFIVPDLPCIEYPPSLTALRRVANQRANVTRKHATGRLTHSLLGMKRDYRHLVQHKDGHELCLLDAKSCFPHLLVSFIDEKEKADYLALFDGGFYNSLKPMVPKRASETPDDYTARVKKAFAQYVSGKCPNRICEYFAQRFPKLHKTITGSNMAQRLQDLEASIFVDGMVQACHILNLPFIPMHDGAIILKKDFKKVKEILSMICTEKLGYDLVVESKPLTHNKQTKRGNGSKANVTTNCTFECVTSDSSLADTILNFKKIVVSSTAIESADIRASISAEMVLIRSKRDEAAAMMAEAIAAHKRATMTPAERRRAGYEKFLEARARYNQWVLDSIFVPPPEHLEQLNNDTL
jgi:hypothetical protein